MKKIFFILLIILANIFLINSAQARNFRINSYKNVSENLITGYTYGLSPHEGIILKMDLSKNLPKKIEKKTMVFLRFILVYFW